MSTFPLSLLGTACRCKGLMSTFPLSPPAGRADPHRQRRPGRDHLDRGGLRPAGHGRHDAPHRPARHERGAQRPERDRTRTGEIQLVSYLRCTFSYQCFRYSVAEQRSGGRGSAPLQGPCCTEACCRTRSSHGAVGRRIDPSWGGPIELFLVPASAPRLV